jgi:hypothetical protein
MSRIVNVTTIVTCREVELSLAVITYDKRVTLNNPLSSATFSIDFLTTETNYLSESTCTFNTLA